MKKSRMHSQTVQLGVAAVAEADSLAAIVVMMDELRRGVVGAA